MTDTWPKPDWQCEGVRLYCGDAATILLTLPEASVQCVVTSPPYWGLRDYGTGTWEGGDAECDHIVGTDRNDTAKRCGVQTGGPMPGGPRYAAGVCPTCGARRIDQQLGLEATPEEYVAKMVAVFRGVRRVLRADGTVWLNLGDSYNGQNARAPSIQPNGSLSYRAGGMAIRVNGLKPKDLCGIPWRVAFGLQADGWWLRQDIIWAKPNPMPESMTDRCTKAHEYIFLLTKSASYHCDMSLIRVPAVESNASRPRMGQGPNTQYKQKRQKMKMPDGWATHEGGHGSFHRDGREKGQPNNADAPDTANRKSVWTVPTKPYPKAHFATYPPELIEPCIVAGCPAGGIVLDPFMGSGTTALVALKHGCQAVGIELNRDYLPMILERIDQERRQGRLFREPIEGGQNQDDLLPLTPPAP